jgi:hypothetical protein
LTGDVGRALWHHFDPSFEWFDSLVEDKRWNQSADTRPANSDSPDGSHPEPYLPNPWLFEKAA